MEATPFYEKWLDVDLDSNAFNNIEITLSPCSSEPERVIVEALLKNYTTNGQMKESQLKGTIKCK